MSRILAALLHVIIALTGALAAAVAAPRDLTVWLQLGVITAGAIVTYLVPLADVRWRAWLKIVFGAVVPGVVAAAVPFIPGIGQGFDPQNVLPLIFAVLVAVGTQLGVDTRVGAVPVVPDAQTVTFSVAAPNPETTGGD